MPTSSARPNTHNLQQARPLFLHAYGFGLFSYRITPMVTIVTSTSAPTSAPYSQPLPLTSIST